MALRYTLGPHPVTQDASTDGLYRLGADADVFPLEEDAPGLYVMDFEFEEE